MPADLSVTAAVPATRWPQAVVLRFTARRAARSGVLWGYVFGLYAAASAWGYASAYKTPSARARLVATLGNNLGFNALIGPAHQIGTVAGFTSWRSLGTLSVIGAIWGLLTGTRFLRGEEDSGRWELCLAGQTTREVAAAQALAGVLSAVAIAWAITAVMVIAVGREHDFDFTVSSSLFLALALVMGAVVFVAVGAVTSQLAATRRRAAGYAAGVLGVAYALRMIADSGIGVAWLRWVSPLGWIEEMRPMTSPRPWLLLPVATFTAALAMVAVFLAGRRDLGDSVIHDRPDATARTRLLAGPARLALRLTDGVAVAWAVSISLTALMMGLISKSVGSALATDAGDRNAFAKLGLRGNGTEQYLAITFLLVATLVVVIAAGQIGYARNEEGSGRLDNLLVRPMSRYRWLGGRLAVATAYILGASVIAGFFAWVGTASQHGGLGMRTLLDAGLNVAPPGLFVLGIGTLALGLVPRSVAVVTYGLVVWSLLVEFVGTVVNASHWILDTSLFHQMAAAPASAPDWTTNAVLVLIGVLSAASGMLAFRHRDLAGD